MSCGSGVLARHSAGLRPRRAHAPRRVQRYDKVTGRWRASRILRLGVLRPAERRAREVLMRTLTGPRSAHDRRQLEERARALRDSPTRSEELLWSALRARQLGVTFRRQVLVGRYIVDFVAPAARLVVEIDGSFHASRQRSDARRDAALESAGYRVLRLEAQLVLDALPTAVSRIRAAL